MGLYTAFGFLNFPCILTAFILYFSSRRLKDNTESGKLFRRILIIDVFGCVGSFATYTVSHIYQINFLSLAPTPEHSGFIYNAACIMGVLLDVFLIELSYCVVRYGFSLAHAFSIAGEADFLNVTPESLDRPSADRHTPSSLKETALRIESVFVRLRIIIYVCISIGIVLFVTAPYTIPYYIFLVLAILTMMTALFLFFYSIIILRKHIPKEKYIYLALLNGSYWTAFILYAFTDYSIIFPLLTVCLLLLFITIQMDNINLSSLESVRKALSTSEQLNTLLQKQYEKQKEAYDALAEETKRINQIGDIFVCLYEINLPKRTFRQLGTLPDDLESIMQEEISHADMQTIMWEAVRRTAHSSYIDSLIAFTDFRTLPDRLKGNKTIQLDGLNYEKKWHRYFFMNPSDRLAEPTDTVFFIVFDINSDRQKLESLSEISFTDKLTGVYNRNAFIADTAKFKDVRIPHDLWFVTVDLNGLKAMNDTVGHHAGDELLIAAADCIRNVFIDSGTVYRVGGDEFCCLIRMDQARFHSAISQLRSAQVSWQGTYADHLSFSLGYVHASEMPGAALSDLASEADRRMYLEKKRYYEQHKELDRRHH